MPRCVSFAVEEVSFEFLRWMVALEEGAEIMYANEVSILVFGAPALENISVDGDEAGERISHYHESVLDARQVLDRCIAFTIENAVSPKLLLAPQRHNGSLQRTVRISWYANRVRHVQGSAHFRRAEVTN